MKSTLGTDICGRGSKGQGARKGLAPLLETCSEWWGWSGTSHFPGGSYLSPAFRSFQFYCVQRMQRKGARQLTAEWQRSLGLADGLFEQQECGLISCCLQSPVPPRWASFHPANTQATRFLSLQTTMACVLGYYNMTCSVWLWKNQAGTLLKTHTWEQWVALPTWAPNLSTHLRSQL